VKAYDDRDLALTPLVGGDGGLIQIDDRQVVAFDLLNGGIPL